MPDLRRHGRNRSWRRRLVLAWHKPGNAAIESLRYHCSCPPTSVTTHNCAIFFVFIPLPSVFDLSCSLCCEVGERLDEKQTGFLLKGSRELKQLEVSPSGIFERLGNRFRVNGGPKDACGPPSPAMFKYVSAWTGTMDYAK